MSKRTFGPNVLWMSIVFCTCVAQAQAKDDDDTLVLNVQFAITKAVNSDQAHLDAAKLKTLAWVAEAEKLYTRSPRLKINASYRFDTINVPTTFKNYDEARKFLKQHYDNIVGDSKTEGALVVAVTATGSDITKSDKTKSDDDAFGGLSFYPDSINPLARKHGIALSVGKADGSFAHELGHTFGLLHAFEGSYGLAENCNKDFPKKEEGTRDGNRINAMDHNLKNGDEIWLNACQADKAADHRKRLRTNDGKTNYKKL